MTTINYNDIRSRIVYDLVRDEAPFLAGDLGFTYVATLSRGDLRKRCL